MFEQKSWSSLSLSGETRLKQKAIDKATRLKLLAEGIGIPIERTTVLTDNLSLQRVIQSERPTQGKGLRREVAIIRDHVVYSRVQVRLVKSPSMLADHLT